MQFTVHKIRSINQAEIEISGITLITGRNQSGKSTLLETAAACMLGDRKLYGATQADAGGVVQAGASVASARIMADAAAGDMADWSTGLIFPKSEHTEHGERPPSNEITMGRVDPFADLTAKDWAGFVRSISGGGRVTGSAVESALRGNGGYPEPHILAVIDTLKQGWDAVTKLCEDRRGDARKTWEKATGERFGTSKAQGWKHPDDTGGLPNVEHLQAELKSLESELSKSLAMQEIGSKNHDELKALIDEQGEAANKLGSKLEAIRTELAKVQKELSYFPGSDPLSCPCCGVLLALKAGTLAEHQETEFVRNSDAHKDLIERKADLQEQERTMTNERGTIVTEQTANLSVLKRSQSTANGGRAAEDIKKAIEAAQKNITASRASEGALQAFSEWRFWDHAHSVVCPTGLRMQATVKSLKELNPRLASLGKALFPGHTLALVHDEKSNRVELTYDGRPYELQVWSGDPNSFALRAKILFQILEAQRLDNEAFIIIDRLDILQKSHKNGVFKALIQLGITALIGQTMNDKPEKDALKGGGYGRTYWINDGDVEAVA